MVKQDSKPTLEEHLRKIQQSEDLLCQKMYSWFQEALHHRDGWGPKVERGALFLLVRLLQRHAPKEVVIDNKVYNCNDDSSRLRDQSTQTGYTSAEHRERIMKIMFPNRYKKADRIQFQEKATQTVCVLD